MALFKLGVKHFPSKKAAKVFVSNFLKSYPHKQPLTDKELAWVFPLFQRHPRAMSKLFNLNHVYVDQNGSCASFVLEYENGTVDDISYIKCFNSSENDKTLCVNAALRNAVRNDIHAFKEAAFAKDAAQMCSFCSKPLDPGFETNVDHISTKRPFCGLVYDFLKLKKMNIENIEIDHVRFGNNSHQELKDKAFEEEWISYHKMNASLQLVCRICNAVDSHNAKRAKKRDGVHENFVATI